MFIKAKNYRIISSSLENGKVLLYGHFSSYLVKPVDDCSERIGELIYVSKFYEDEKFKEAILKTKSINEKRNFLPLKVRSVSNGRIYFDIPDLKNFDSSWGVDVRNVRMGFSHDGVLGSDLVGKGVYLHCFEDHFGNNVYWMDVGKVGTIEVKRKKEPKILTLGLKFDGSVSVCYGFPMVELDLKKLSLDDSLEFSQMIKVYEDWFRDLDEIHGIDYVYFVELDEGLLRKVRFDVRFGTKKKARAIMYGMQSYFIEARKPIFHISHGDSLWKECYKCGFENDGKDDEEYRCQSCGHVTSRALCMAHNIFVKVSNSYDILKSIFANELIGYKKSMKNEFLEEFFFMN